MANPTPIRTNGALFVDDGSGTGTRVQVADNDPIRATYGYFITGFVPAANPTDIFTLACPTGGKIIKLRSLMLCGTATTASNVIIDVIRRSSVNTGGTTSAPTPVKRDSLADAPTAVLTQYSANPTALGSPSGLLDGGRLNLAPAANGSIDRMIFQYSWLNDQAIIIRPTAGELIALNLGGSAWPAGGALDIAMSWTEE